MDQLRRDEIKTVINECRRILEEEFAAQLRYLGYNLDQSIIRIPIEKLTHLSSEAQKNRIWIDEAITKQMKSALNEKQAILRYINHCSFTFINRISALRAMEVRNLIEETIIPRDEYGGHSLRGRRISEENKSWNDEKILLETLKQGFHDVQNEIGSLFDENNEFAIISPNHRVSKQIIHLLSKRLTDEDWKTDEILGWIYQFFNCQTRDIFKEKKKEEKENPHPDEIPLINQFYTPKWVVQILVMNTIGRIYASINPKSDLKNNWSYFINLDNQTHDKVLNDIKKIKILDPACGSGHFLIYSFDILYYIYKEFYQSMNDQEIINSILWNNLHGIDIDLRAIQIAGLNLYLKAKSINKNVKITNMNLICADSKIIDKEKTKKIIQKLNFSVELQDSFISLFNDLEICYALGSILKIPNEFIMNWKNKKTKQRSIDYFSEINENTDRSIINILKKLEKEAMDTKNVSDMMFYNETEKSIGLLTLLSQKYDVILMNPPYGAIPKITKEYIKRKYTIGYSEDETQKNYIPYHDYYETFLLQCNNLLKENGFVGMLIPNSYLYLDSFDYLRKYLFQEELLPIYNLDLGYGILDQATTRTAAAVLNKIHKANGKSNDKIEGYFWDLKNFETHELKYSNFISSIADHKNSKIFFKRNIKSFNFMASTPYYYYMPNEIFDLLENNYQLDDRTKDVKEKITLLEWGISTGDDTRYLRYIWEIKSNEIGINKKWRYCVAGGTRTPYLNSIDTVILWNNDGQEIRNMRYKDGTMKSRPKDSEFWNRINNSYGFIWPKIKSKDFLNVSFRPKYVTSLDSNGIGNLLDSNLNLNNLMGILNSQIITKIVKIFDPLDHFRFVKTIAQLPIPKQWKHNEMNQLVREIITYLIFFEFCNEKSIIFRKPILLISLENSSNMDLGIYDLNVKYDILSTITINSKPISDRKSVV
jgi:SAM-dependent methyltransferase